MSRRYNPSFKQGSLYERQRRAGRKPAHGLYFRRHNYQSPDRQEAAQREHSRSTSRSSDVPNSLCERRSQSSEESRKSTARYYRYASERRSESEFRPSTARYYHYASAHRHESPDRRLYTRNLADDESEDEQFYTRRSPLDRQKKRENFSKPTEAKHQVTDSRPVPPFLRSDIDIATFLEELQALPTDVFLKLVDMKLDVLEINEISDLSEVGKFISMSKRVLSKHIPPGFDEVLKSIKSSETKSNLSKSPLQPKIAEVPKLTRGKELPDLSKLIEILEFAKRESLLSASSSDQHASSTETREQRAFSVPTVTSEQHASSSRPLYQYSSSFVHAKRSSTVPQPAHQPHQYASSPYQNRPSYPGVPYEQVDIPVTRIYAPSSNESFVYNTAQSNMIPAVPTLALQVQRESYLFQSQHFQPSFPDRNNFRY